MALLRRRLGTSPGIGRPVERRGTVSLRVLPLGGRLPYLVWYLHDEADPRAPVWLVMLRHEDQDREPFEPPG